MEQETGKVSDVVIYEIITASICYLLKLSKQSMWISSNCTGWCFNFFIQRKGLVKTGLYPE